jgi:hypothetical protein
MAATTPDCSPPALTRREAARRFAHRGLRIEAAALVIAGCLWALFREPFWLTVVYSLCISTMCWLFIEVGRAAAAGLEAFFAAQGRQSLEGRPGAVGVDFRLVFRRRKAPCGPLVSRIRNSSTLQHGIHELQIRKDTRSL